MTNGNGSGFTIGLLFGAAVGAALGLLFAPKSGLATRRELAKSADGLRKRGMKLYDKAAEAAADATEQVNEGY